jgi:hypothetical protein
MKDLVYLIPIDTTIEVLKAALHQGNILSATFFSNDRQHY